MTRRHRADRLTADEPVVAQRRQQPDRAAPTTERAAGTDEVGGEALAFQRLAGNRATAGLVQAKLTVGPVDDPLEHEADRVASEVMRNLQDQAVPSPSDPVQREGLEDEELLMKPSVQRDVQREGLEDEELLMKPSVQRQSIGLEGGEVDDQLDADIAQARGGGQALDPVLRQSMEGAFGVDFSSVRIHDDAASDGLNQQIQARAFTTGSDVFFRSGEYQPTSSAGQELLAHELTHVVQQGGAPDLE